MDRQVSAAELREGDQFLAVFTVKRVRAEFQSPKVVVGEVENSNGGSTEVEISARTLSTGKLFLLSRHPEPVKPGDLVTFRGEVAEVRYVDEKEIVARDEYGALCIWPKSVERVL